MTTDCHPGDQEIRRSHWQSPRRSLVIIIMSVTTDCHPGGQEIRRSGDHTDCHPGDQDIRTRGSCNNYNVWCQWPLTVTQEITQKTDTGRAEQGLLQSDKYKLSVSRHFTPVCYMSRVSALSVAWQEGPDESWAPNAGVDQGGDPGPLMDNIIWNSFAIQNTPSLITEPACLSSEEPGARPCVPGPWTPAPVHSSCSSDPSPRRKQGLRDYYCLLLFIIVITSFNKPNSQHFPYDCRYRKLMYNSFGMIW